jgi:hypothetical protein
MRKLLTYLILCALSSVAAVCQAAPMPDDWYVADMVRVNGSPMVCPPGVQSSGLMVSRRDCGSHQPMSPVDYLSARCPSATRVSLQPFFVPSQGIEPTRLVLGYTHPASGKFPSQAGQL